MAILLGSLFFMMCLLGRSSTTISMDPMESTEFMAMSFGERPTTASKQRQGARLQTTFALTLVTMGSRLRQTKLCRGRYREITASWAIRSFGFLHQVQERLVFVRVLVR